MAKKISNFSIATSSSASKSRAILLPIALTTRHLTVLDMATKKDNKISGTDLIHGDSGIHRFKGAGAAVAPSISVSTSELPLYDGGMQSRRIDTDTFSQLLKVLRQMKMSSPTLR